MGRRYWFWLQHHAWCRRGSSARSCPPAQSRRRRSLSSNAVRHGCPAAFAVRGPSIAPGHLGRRPCLIDEHQPLQLEIDLGVEPGLSPAENVGPLLLGGVRSPFVGHVVTIEQAPDGALRHIQTMGLPEIVDLLGEREVGVLHQGQDIISMCFKSMGAMDGASCTRSNAACMSLLVDPFDCGRRRNTEKLRSRPSRHPTCNSRY